MMNNKKYGAVVVYLLVATCSMHARSEYESLSLRLTATEDRLRNIEKELHDLTVHEDKVVRERRDTSKKIAVQGGLKKNTPSSRGRCHEGLYPLPQWPFYSTFYDHQDLLKIDLSIQTAGKSYNENGHSSDLSAAMFGSDSITLKDILLASALVDQGKLLLPGFNGAAIGTLLDRGLIELDTYAGAEPCPPTPIGGNSYRFTKAGYYLGILADQKFAFDSSQTDYSVALNYSRNFHDGDVTLGFYLPLVARSHRIKLTSSIPSDKLAIINEIETVNNRVETNFTSLYPTLETFFDAILQEKGIDFNKSGTIVGLGDVSLYASTHFRNPHVSRLMTGVSLLLPTGRDADSTKLWQKPLGNGGFVELGLFGSVLLGKGAVFNPYIHTQAAYVCSSRVYRRIPRVVSYDGQEPIPGTSPANEAGYQLPMADALAFLENVTFSQPDTTVRCFSDQIHKVSIRKGPKLFIRAGNIFADVFSRKGFVDVFYDMHFQGSDHIKHDATLATWSITQHTTTVAHSLGIDYSYQHNAGLRLRIGGGYVFAGQNTPQTLSFEGSLNYDF